MLNERLQILLSAEQRRRLEDEARRRDVSVASLVREAVDARFGGVGTDERLRAVEEIGRMEGRYRAPDELERLAEGERARELERVLGTDTR